jgi:hypothetical protein
MPNETRSPLTPEYLADLQTKALETLAAVADLNHRILQEMVELSATTTKAGVRTCAEIQSAAVDAARKAQGPSTEPADFAGLRENPFAWYQKSLLTLADGTRAAFGLLEANAEIATRSAERFQASADRTVQQIQEALTSTATRMKEIYRLG